MIDCVELRNRAGRDTAIFVEGSGDDEWFYNQWFNDRPVVFFSGGSWRQVQETVVRLRHECPDISIYGILDRDLTVVSEWEGKEMDEWQTLISGKYVLKHLHASFPRRQGRGQFDLDRYLNEYLRGCPEPPADLIDLVEFILR